RAIRATLDPLASCSTSGALPGYLPLYGTLVAAFAGVTGFDAGAAMTALAPAFHALMVIVAYLVAARIVDRAAAFPLAALWLALHPAPILRYPDFTAALLVPLWALALTRFLEGASVARALGLGLTLALLGLSHAVAFIGATAVSAGAVAVDVV